MSFQAAAETQIFIGTKAPDFMTDAFVKIGGLATIGDFGDDFDIRTLEPLSDPSLSRKIKIARNSGTSGSIDVAVLFDVTDAGQNALNAALGDIGAGTVDSAAYNFKIELNDKPATGTPTTIYFRAIVATGKFRFGSASDPVKRIYTLEIDSDISLVPAAV